MKRLKKIFTIITLILIIVLLIFAFKKLKNSDVKSKTEVKSGSCHPKYDSRYIRKINNIKISNAEIKNKYEFVYLSDLHISIVDENEEDEKIKESLLKRNLSFYGDMDSATVKSTISEIVKYTNNKKATALLLGGDIIDSPAESSRAVLRENLKNLKTDYLYTLGNHDWTFLWDYQSEETKEKYLPEMKEFMDDINVSYLEYEDLIVLAINSSTNKIEEESLSKIKAVLEKQKPTIVMMHVPISTPEIADFSFKYRDRVSAIGEGGIELDQTTQEAFDMILSEKYKVFYILAGHVHVQMETDLNKRVHQFITEAAYFGNINVVQVN